VPFAEQSLCPSKHIHTHTHIDKQNQEFFSRVRLPNSWWISEFPDSFQISSNVTGWWGNCLPRISVHLCVTSVTSCGIEIFFFFVLTLFHIFLFLVMYIFVCVCFSVCKCVSTQLLRVVWRGLYKHTTHSSKFFFFLLVCFPSVF